MKVRLLQASPTARLLALAVMAISVAGLGLHWVNASASRHHQETKPSDATSTQVGAGGCQLEIGGKLVHLQLGEGIRTSAGWRNCDTYDGHPLIVYSASPPPFAATAQDDRPAGGRLPVAH
jgi:hypothetical protein